VGAIFREKSIEFSRKFGTFCVDVFSEKKPQ
jgi:hypothetical protein